MDRKEVCGPRGLAGHRAPGGAYGLGSTGSWEGEVVMGVGIGTGSGKRVDTAYPLNHLNKPEHRLCTELLQGAHL